MADPADLDAQVQRAKQLTDLRRYDASDGLLRRVLAADPDHLEALNSLSFLRYRVDDYAESAELARRMIAVAPYNDTAYHRLAEALRFSGRLVEAEQAAREALRLDPDDPMNLETLADVFGQQGGRVAESERLLRDAAAGDPERSAPFERLARLFRRQARWPDAIAAAEEALARSPMDVVLLVLLGELRLAAGELVGAADAFTSALRIAPSRVDMDELLRTLVEYGVPGEVAGLYGMLGTALGRPDLTRPGAAGTDPGLRDAQVSVAQALLDGGQLPRARAVIDELLTADPGHFGARRLRGELLYLLDRDADAVAVCRALVADGDDSEDTAVLLVRSLVEAELHDEAVREARAGGQRWPHRPEFPAAESAGLLGIGDRDGAVLAARAAIELAPHRASIQWQLAAALRASGDAGGAEAALREAVAKYPDNSKHWYSLGAHELLRGRTEQAIEAFERADELAPDEFGARLQVGLGWLIAGRLTAAEDALSAVVGGCDEPDLVRMVDMLETVGAPGGLAGIYRRACARLGRVPFDPAGPELRAGRATYAVTMMHIGREELAEEHLAELIAAYPADAAGLAAFAELRRRQDRYAEAVELAERAVAATGPVAPDGPAPPLAALGHSALVSSLLRLDRTADAIAAARDAQSRFPDNDVFYAFEASALLDLGGALPAAMASIRRAIEIDPVDVWSRQLFGRALLLAGERAAATSQLRRARELDGDDAAVACWLGVALALDGAADEAAELRALLPELPPLDPDERTELARHLAAAELPPAAAGFLDWCATA